MPTQSASQAKTYIDLTHFFFSASNYSIRTYSTRHPPPVRWLFGSLIGGNSLKFAAERNGICFHCSPFSSTSTSLSGKLWTSFARFSFDPKARRFDPPLQTTQSSPTPFSPTPPPCPLGKNAPGEPTRLPHGLHCFTFFRHPFTPPHSNSNLHSFPLSRPIHPQNNGL